MVQGDAAARTPGARIGRTVTADQQQRYLASSLELSPGGRGRSDLRGRLEQPLFVLLAATALVLLLACLNVANLFLARGFARRRETALCLALGASRSRMVRDLLVQCGIVAVGGARARRADRAGRDTHAAVVSPDRAAEVDLSPAINVAGLRLRARRRVVTALLFGLAPAFRAARAKPRSC